MEMKKIKEKTARSLVAFLAAVCMFVTMPGMTVISRAEEGIGQSIEAYDADGQEENREDADTKEQDGEKTGEGTGKPKDSEESEDTEKTGDTEESKDLEESGDKENAGESGAGGTGDLEEKVPEEEDPGKEEIPEELPEGEADKESEESDAEEEEPAGEEETTEGEENAEETELEESEEVGVMLLSAQAAEGSAVQDADSTYTDGNGVIYHYYGYEDGTAEIYELEDCKESTWDYKALSFPSQIGDYTVTRLTFTLASTTPVFPSVTIPETVTYMKDSLFKRMTIRELYYNAEAAETGAGGESTGVFFQANIRELHIGGNVKVIPDYCFASAKITMDELTIDVERIGCKAFYYDKAIATLTIGENVKEIGKEAFARNEIENIYYNAVNAVSEPYGETILGTFGNITVSGITIGSRVTAIPEHLFCGIDYTADTLVFPECLTTVGAWAFYGDDITIGALTIGENMTSIGAEAFAVGHIGLLNYNAVDARLDGVTESNRHRTAFEGVEVGELRIGNRVKGLPDTLFYAMGLNQDALILPDSITYIGAYVLSHSGDNNSGKAVQIGTLEIGDNVVHIGRAAFGCNTYDKVVVRTVETDVPPRSDIEMELPSCSEIEIHGKSPYYDFFTKRTEKEYITLLCEDFEVTRGEEYYDAGKKSFVTPITDVCTVCGYGTTRNEYSEACTVIFTDYDGRELSRQHIHKGDDAEAPEEPERTGYRFMGWDKGFTNVTSDLTVRAEYEIKKFTVVFKDGDHTISEQEIEYKKDAKAPENPTRPTEEWGNWRFTGWNGSYTNVTKDEVVTAQFEKVLNKYEVIFYDAEGNVISRQTIAHGEDAEEPEIPEKEPTAQYTYIFTGWSAATEGITGDTAFYPVYDTATRSYTVKFMDGGTVLDTQKVAYGEDATAPADPIRPEEEWGSWEFTGWRGSYTHITKDEIIWAGFEQVFHVYEVIFYDADDNILSRQTVRYGMGAEAPEAPDMKPTEKECYVFAGWDGDISRITGISHFHPVYETKPRTYTVTFMNGDISYDVQKVAYGSAAVTPADPVKEEDETYTYRFVGWDRDYSCITGDLTVHAVFEQVIKPKDDPDKDKPDEDGQDKEKDKPKGDDTDGKKPGDGDGGQQPGGETGTEGGQLEGDPVGDAGEKNGDPSPETIAEKTILRREALREVTDGKKPVFPIPEIPDRSTKPGEQKVQAEEPEEQESMQTAESEETEGAHRQIPGWLWLLLLLGAGTGAWGIWLWLAGTDERTICGTVMDEDGNVMSGVNVTLTGEEGKPVETQTDEDGQYLFEDLKKNSYRLCFHYMDATGLLLLDIHMERRDRKKVFSILKSTVNAVETKRSGGRYQIDVTV